MTSHPTTTSDRTNGQQETHTDTGRTGDRFTLYTAAVNGTVHRSSILLHYEPASAAARLGAFSWQDGGAAKSLPVHLISDVFLGMQSAVFQCVTGSTPVEDHCFSLVSRGISLDLEGESLEATKHWLKQLSAIINSSGKDIVLAAKAPTDTPSKLTVSGTDANQQQPPQPPLSPSTVNPMNWKVDVTPPNGDSETARKETTEATNGIHVSAVEAAPAAVAVKVTPTAHELMQPNGAGFPFTFHYTSLDGHKLTRTQLLMHYTPTNGGAFVLKTSAPSLRPTNPHSCLTEPHTFVAASADGQSGDLCIWESKLLLDGLSDVYLGVSKGLFASSPSLSGLDAARCVTLASDVPPPVAHWDLEAANAPAFVDWLAAFNSILQATDQQVEVNGSDAAAAAAVVAEVAPAAAPVASPTTIANNAHAAWAPPAAATVAASPAPAPSSVVSSSLSPLDVMRRGGFFYLYTPSSVAGGANKKLIRMFYNDDLQRPMHFSELQLQQEQSLYGPADQSLLRSSLFYRYVAEIDAGSDSGPNPQPTQTDECVSILHVSDLLLGKQTPLMCLTPLTTFVSNEACFSLVVSRTNFATGQVEPVELGLECVQPATQMATWLEGIMAVSNRVSGEEEEPAPSTVSVTTTTTVEAVALNGAASPKKPAPLHIPAPSQSSITLPASFPSTSAHQASDRVLTIEHVVASPRVQPLKLDDPILQELERGQLFWSWEDYQRPTRRKILLFYSPSATLGSNALIDTGASNLPAFKASGGGFFFWNYLENQEGGWERPAAGAREYTKSVYRSFALESLQSVYHGRVASIFQQNTNGALLTASGGSLLSLLTTDDLLNLEASSSHALDSFLASLKHLLQAACAKNLIKVALAPEDDGTLAGTNSSESTASAGSGGSGGEGGDAAEFEVKEWFNIQEAVFPLADAAVTKPAVASLSVAPTPVSSPTGGAGGTTSMFPPMSPRSSDDALLAFARGQQFSSWSALTTGGPGPAEVQVTPITLFFQQTPQDHALFFVWVASSKDPHQQQQQVRDAKLWSRTIKQASDLSGLPQSRKVWYPHLLVSTISDLHIGKNLPIFTNSRLGATLIADECVSIVAADAKPTPQELHLVATEGIGQIARAISAVTNLLERDGVPLSEQLQASLGADDEDQATSPVKKLDFTEATTTGAGAAAAAALSDEPSEPLLKPLHAGSRFFLWCFRSPSDESSAARIVERREVQLKWTNSAELGVLSWTFLGSQVLSSASVGPTSMLVSGVTDIFVGAESAAFAPAHQVATMDDHGVFAAPMPHPVRDENCFSILSSGAELNLESTDANVVNAWVDGLSLLLQSGGRSLTEEPAASLPGVPSASAAAAAAVVPAPSPVVVPAATGAPVPSPVREFPSLPPVASLEDILHLVQVLAATKAAGELASYRSADVERGLAAIRDAAATQPPELMESVMAGGAADVVVGCMRAFKDVEGVQLTGAGACWCLATTGENEMLVVNAGGLDINRENLSRYPTNPMLLQQICGAIRNLICHPQHKKLFVFGGERLQLAGQEAAAATTTDAEEDLPPSSASPAGIAACKCLIAALSDHASATALAQQASGSIAALAMYGPNKSVLGSAGAIPALVSAMRAHPGSDEAAAQVHEECNAALRNLAASHSQNKELISACGGIEAIVASMHAHRDSAVNQLHSAGALWNVPSNNAPNKSRVAACGGIQALLTALTVHAQDAEVQLEAIGSLRNLSTLAENKPLILAAGAIPIVIDAMQRMIHVSLLQEQSCALLFNLTNYQQADGAAGGVQALMQQDAPKLVLKVLATHLASPNVVEEACACLWIMHRSSPLSSDWPSGFATQVVSLADQALAAHASNAGVVNFASGMKAAFGQPAPIPVDNDGTLDQHGAGGILSPQRSGPVDTRT